MFSNNMYKTVWDAMQQGDIEVCLHVNRPGNENNRGFASGTVSALSQDGIGTEDINFVTVSGFYKNGEIVLYENPNNDEIHVYGRYKRLAILPNDPDFDYARELALINLEQYESWRERGYNRCTGWDNIHRKYGI